MGADALHAIWQNHALKRSVRLKVVFGDEIVGDFGHLASGIEDDFAKVVIRVDSVHLVDRCGDGDAANLEIVHEVVVGAVVRASELCDRIAVDAGWDLDVELTVLERYGFGVAAAVVANIADPVQGGRRVLVFGAGHIAGVFDFYGLVSPSELRAGIVVLVTLGLVAVARGTRRLIRPAELRAARHEIHACRRAVAAAFGREREPRCHAECEDHAHRHAQESVRQRFPSTIMLSNRSHGILRSLSGGRNVAGHVALSH